MRRWQQPVEIHQLLLALDKTLFSQWSLSLHVLEHLHGEWRDEHVGLGAEFFGKHRRGDKDVSLYARLLLAEASHSFCRRGCTQAGHRWHLRRCAGICESR